jgi:hypothetical protein
MTKTSQTNLNAPVKVTSVEITPSAYDGNFIIVGKGHVGIGTGYHEFKTVIKVTKDLALHADMFYSVIMEALIKQHEAEHLQTEEVDVEGI